MKNEFFKQRFVLCTKSPHIGKGIFLLLCFLFLFSNHSKVYGAAANPPDVSNIILLKENEEMSNPTTKNQKIVSDKGEILSKSEESELESLCTQYSKANNMDILILTTKKIPSTREKYLEDFYDAHDEIRKDTALILINMDPNDRGVEIQGYGRIENSIAHTQIEHILDMITPKLASGNYFEALQQYVILVNDYMQPTPFLGGIYVWLIISLVIGGIVVCVMAFQSNGPKTISAAVYLDQQQFKVIDHYDRYIRSTTTKTKKPEPNQNSSHSGGNNIGGGTSSGGHSHSGGGRNF